MSAHLDSLLVHRFERIRRDDSRGCESGARRRNYIAAVNSREGLRHLATAGVPNTDKKDTLQGLAHSFSRKYRWTRESSVSSGWKVATRCLPCSTSTGSPL